MVEEAIATVSHSVYPSSYSASSGWLLDYSHCRLMPSSFSRSLLPIITFAVSLFAVVFGMMSGRLNTLSDILGALSNGLSRSAPLVVIAILLIQFIASLGFVFN